MKKNFFQKSLLILFILCSKVGQAQFKESIFSANSDNLFEYLEIISGEKFLNNKLNSVLKLNDVFKDYKYYPKNQNLIELFRNIKSDMFDIYTKDSIIIKGKNEDVLLRNYISKSDDRDFQMVESISNYNNHLFFCITGYETWYNVVVNLYDDDVYVFSDLPALINKDEFIIVSNYYGEGVFYYFNSVTKKILWFNLSNLDIKDYYLSNGKVFFEFISNNNSQTYFYSLSYKG